MVRPIEIAPAPCSKCGIEDFPKYRRMKLRKTGKKTLSIASYCILCHREDQKIREEKRYTKKLAYNRLWCKNNRDKVNRYNRKHYKKNQYMPQEHSYKKLWRT
jgi:hypothetical protein